MSLNDSSLILHPSSFKVEMDWERVLINFGMVAGFIALMAFWLGLAMWLRVDADKHGMIGWVWAWIGIIGGPVALFIYLFVRGTRPVLSVVSERDILIEEATRTGIPSDFNPDSPPSSSEETLPEQPSVLSKETQAALDAEERRFKSY